MSESKEVVRKVGRDSGNGQFIQVKEAQKRPKTTEVEKINILLRKRNKCKISFPLLSEVYQSYEMCSP